MSATAIKRVLPLLLIALVLAMPTLINSNYWLNLLVLASQLLHSLPWDKHRPGIHRPDEPGPGRLLGRRRLHLHIDNHEAGRAGLDRHDPGLRRRRALRHAARGAYPQAVRPLPGRSDHRLRDHRAADPHQRDQSHRRLRRHSPDPVALHRGHRTEGCQQLLPLSGHSPDHVYLGIHQAQGIQVRPGASSHPGERDGRGDYGHRHHLLQGSGLQSLCCLRRLRRIHVRPQRLPLHQPRHLLLRPVGDPAGHGSAGRLGLRRWVHRRSSAAHHDPRGAALPQRLLHDVLRRGHRSGDDLHARRHSGAGLRLPHRQAGQGLVERRLRCVPGDSSFRHHRHQSPAGTH